MMAVSRKLIIQSSIKSRQKSTDRVTENTSMFLYYSFTRRELQLRLVSKKLKQQKIFFKKLSEELFSQ